MAYQSLAKLFYTDASGERFERNEQLAQERFNAESTFKTGIDSDHGELFLAVPRELSVINEKILRVERVVSARLRQLPPVAHAAMLRSLVIDEVVSTNELEGVHSTRKQINDLLAGSVRTATSPHGKSAGRRFSELTRMYLGLSDPNVRRPETAKEIRAIYDQLMAGEQLGENKLDGVLFRAHQVEVIGQGGKTLHEGVMPEEKIIELLDKMIALVDSSDVPEMYSAIIAHYVFEFIHPFYDGNGRTGRYLLALYLSKPLSMLTTLSLSKTIAENKSAYYTAFKDTEHPLNHGELTMFVMKMLEFIRVAQERLLDELDVKLGQFGAMGDRLINLSATAKLGKAGREIIYMLGQFDLFALFPQASLEEIAQHVSLGTQQTRKHLSRLEEMGLVEVSRKRPLLFELSDVARNELGLG